MEKGVEMYRIDIEKTHQALKDASVIEHGITAIVSLLFYLGCILLDILIELQHLRKEQR